jgi:hypothetical protein
MKFIFKLILSYCIAIIPTGIFARDVNLDSIYINNPALSNNLKNLKLDAYSSAKSIFVSNNVAFAHWIQKDELVFIKESAKSASVFRYKLNGAQTPVCSVQGTVTVCIPSASGKYLYLKTMESVNNKPFFYFITVDLEKSTFVKKSSSYPFLDFTVSPKNDAYIYFDGDSFIEVSPNGSSKKILGSKEFSIILPPKLQQTLLLYSPNYKNKLVLSGNDADYQSIILGTKGNSIFGDLSSSSEIFWIDNSRILFRTGHSGNFSIALFNYNASAHKTILENSLNTNICFSPLPKIASFVDHQLINIYNVSNNSITNIGLEGEDTYFSSNGLFFTSLLYKRLYITRVDYTKKYREEILSHVNDIIAIYSQVLRNKSYWKNDFTPEYCKRKLEAYQKLNRGDNFR